MAGATMAAAQRTASLFASTSVPGLVEVRNGGVVGLNLEATVMKPAVAPVFFYRVISIIIIIIERHIIISDGFFYAASATD